MRIFLSVVIPTYQQSEKTIQLLDSIVLPKGIRSEILVVDDGSADQTKQILRQYRRFRLKVMHHLKNRGVAAARNTGAKAAKGDILLFLDGDVQVFPDTLTQVVRTFQTQPGIGGVSGIVVLDKTSGGFFPRYKSLRTYCYWMIENTKHPNRQTLGNACFAVRRDIFEKVGGFNELFKGASIEDNELGHRIVQYAPVIFNPRIKIAHTYESFWPMVQRYVKRSQLWTELFWRRRTFESAGMSRGETINGVVASLTWIFPPFLILHFYLGRRFYGFVRQEEGWVFMVKCLGVQLFLYPLIYVVAAWTTVLFFGRRMVR
ncbi:MAG: glycosyltransferase family 2 protein [bacterium]|nr:glycosyltransferase family 2 protein [bacterium]